MKYLDWFILALMFTLGLVLTAGCSRKDTESSPSSKQPAKPPAFMGVPAKKRIHPDLAGTWQVFGHGWDTTGNPKMIQPPADVTQTKPFERFDVKFLVERRPGPVYVEKNGQGQFKVEDVPPGQVIKWYRADGTVRRFFVQRRELDGEEVGSKHVLQTIGDDGWGYHWVRTEGGHGGGGVDN